MQGNTPTQHSTDTPKLQLLGVDAFQKQAPINLRWCIQKHYQSLVDSEVLFRFGRKLLIDPEQFWIWLRRRGHQDALSK